MAKAVTKSVKTVVGASFKGTELLGVMSGTGIYLDQPYKGESCFIIEEGLNDLTIKVAGKVVDLSKVEIIFTEKGDELTDWQSK